MNSNKKNNNNCFNSQRLSVPSTFNNSLDNNDYDDDI